MKPELAAPCKHAGEPPENVVEKTVEVIQSLANDVEFLNSHGLTEGEYLAAFPAAIEIVRGRMAARNANRRKFLASVFVEMEKRGLISSLRIPSYGNDTIYRIGLSDQMEIAVIQKGCPDGAHSSLAWAKPEWASESYIWWVCSSTAMSPGEHVVKGINRLRGRFLAEPHSDANAIDGVIFHNEVCGTPGRPCPKLERATTIDGVRVPPPCIYVLPKSLGSHRRDLKFPQVLLALFGISESASGAFLGAVDFEKRGAQVRTTVALSFGQGRSTNFRSSR